MEKTEAIAVSDAPAFVKLEKIKFQIIVPILETARKIDVERAKLAKARA